MTENLPEKRRTQVTLNKPLTDLDEAWRLCEALAGSNLVPQALQGRPANILLVIMTGQELGLSVAQSLRTIYAPASGNTQLRGQLVLAKLREAGHDYEFQQDDLECRFTLIRGDNGRKYEGRFTMNDAVRARLVEAHQREDGSTEYLARSSQGKILPWELYAPDMLFWRAVSRAVNRGAPEVMLGFAIMGAAEAVDREPEPVQLQPPNRATAAKGAAAAGQMSAPSMGTASSQAHSGGADTTPAQGRSSVKEGAAGSPAPQEPPSVPADDARVAAAVPEVPGFIRRELAELDAAGDRPAAADPARDEEEESLGAAATQVLTGPGPVPAPPPDELPLEESGPGAQEAAGPAPPAEEPDQQKGSPGHRQQVAALTRRFVTLGWDPRQRRGEVLRACSAYVRRDIHGAGELTVPEATALNAALAGIVRKTDPADYTQVLQAEVDQWEQAWADMRAP
jgi:hypothetical protein